MQDVCLQRGEKKGLLAAGEKGGSGENRWAVPRDGEPLISTYQAPGSVFESEQVSG